MFTGIVQGTATIQSVEDNEGVRTLVLAFPAGFCEGLDVGASVAVDGVCLTVTQCLSATWVKFDVIYESLRVTTLGTCSAGDRVNVERAAKEGAEIGGHPLSGHVDFATPIKSIKQLEGNCCYQITMPEAWSRYIFSKGYIAINGCSLTIAEVNKTSGYFEVWLIPETRRVTTFEHKAPGDLVNIEISRETQILVDTIRTTLVENLGPLLPVFEKMLADQNIDLPALLGAELAALAKSK